MALRERLFGVGATLANLWAGFGGLVAFNVFTDNRGAGAVVGGILSLVAAVLPGTMLYLRRKPPEPAMPEVPGYDRLHQAFEQARRLVTDAVIPAGTLRGVEGRIDELRRLLADDLRNQALGGRPSELPG